mgnify:CR=1 FL=1
MQALDMSTPAAVTHCTAPVICDEPAAKPKRIEDLMREACAVRHYSRRTFQAYWHWSKRFILWSGKRHPRDMGQVEVADFLTWLATAQQVSASTQRQALHGILFMYQAALGIEIGWVDGIVRAKQPQRLPEVLSPSETGAVLDARESGAIAAVHPTRPSRPASRPARRSGQLGHGCSRPGR